MDVWRYYPPTTSRYCEVEQNGDISRDSDDTKVASSKIKIGAEIGIKGIIKAQIKYVRERAENGQAGGGRSHLVGGDGSQLAGGYESQLAGGDGSQLVGGDGSQLVGGDRSQLAGGDESQLVSGDWSQLVSGDRSQLVGGKSSILVCGNNGNAKGGLNSVIVLTQWEYHRGEYIPTVQAITIDGEHYKPDTWYTLKDGEVVEVAE